MPKVPDVREVLQLVADHADDGYSPREELLGRHPAGRREISRALRKAIGGGYLLERRGPDGRLHLALSAEGWALIRSP